MHRLAKRRLTVATVVLATTVACQKFTAHDAPTASGATGDAVGVAALALPSFGFGRWGGTGWGASPPTPTPSRPPVAVPSPAVSSGGWLTWRSPFAPAATPRPSPPAPSPSPSPSPAPTAGPPASTASKLYVSPAGSDVDAGTDPAHPLATIALAARRATPGTTVVIAAGTYHEQVVTTAGGTADAPITFTSPGGAVVDGSQLGWPPAGNQNLGLFEVNHPYVRLDGLAFAHSPDSGIVVNADHTSIRHCQVSDVQIHGITVHSSRQTRYPGFPNTMVHDLTVADNTVTRATLAGNGHGQAISIVADGFAITGNDVHDNVDIGIDIWLGAAHGEVAHNTVHANPGSSGIYVDGATYLRIDANRVYGNKSGIGISSEDPNYATHDVWVYNNLVYQNAGSGCFLWEDLVNQGIPGVQAVLFAHNTVVDNRLSFYLAGVSNTATLANNLGSDHAGGWGDTSFGSTYTQTDNIWLADTTGFTDAAGGDFHPRPGSPCIGACTPVAAFSDDLGQRFAITTDFAGTPRATSGRVDAGAYCAP